MNVPDGMTETEFVDAVDRVLAKIAPSFAHGIYSVEDVKQYGWEEVCLLFSRDRYDPSQPLENWVCRCVRNRFLNLIRDKVSRPGPPCRDCHSGDLCGGGVPCGPYRDWRDRNKTKSSLAVPWPLVFDQPVVPPSPDEELRLRDATESPGDLVPPHLRSSWLMFQAGLSVPKADMDALREAILEAW